MDEIKQDTMEAVWKPVIKNLEVHEDIILRIPNYDRMMERAFPKGSKLVSNIMNELKHKSSQNLKVVRILAGFN